MGRLLKVYLMNIFRQKSFYICLFIDILFAVGIPLLSSLVLKAPNTIPVANRILQGLGVGIIPLLFITIFVCSDFTDGAAKNFIARGYTRRQLLFAKFITCLIAMFVYYLVEAIIILILFSKNGLGFNSSNIIMIIGSLIAIVAAIGFYVIIANTAEKLGAAIAINILVYTLMPTVFVIIPVLLKTDINLSKYWVTSLSSFLPEKGATIMDLLKLSGITIIYLVLLFEASNLIIKRKEVK